MAGVSADSLHGITISDAHEIAKFMVWSGRIPPAMNWIDGLIEKAKYQQAEATLKGIFG